MQIEKGIWKYEVKIIGFSVFCENKYYNFCVKISFNKLAVPGIKNRNNLKTLSVITINLLILYCL